MDDNLRNDGTVKGDGYFGKLDRPDGRVSTEVSISLDIDGKPMEIPLLVPTQKKEYVDIILNTDPKKLFSVLPKEALVLAQQHAIKRIKENKSPFWSNGERVYKKPTLKETSPAQPSKMRPVRVKGVANPMQFPDDMDISDIRAFLQKRFSQRAVAGDSDTLAQQPNVAEPTEPTLSEIAGQGVADFLKDKGIVSSNYSAQQVGKGISSIGEFLPGIGDASAGDKFGYDHVD